MMSDAALTTTTAKTKGSKHSSSADDERSLLVVVVDVSPSAWGEREVKRAANDKARLAQNKRSVGPATLDETLLAVRGFGGAFDSLQRDGVLIVVAVAGNESDVVFPRPNDLQRLLQEGAKMDIRHLNENLVLGVSELVTKAAAKTEESVKTILESKQAVNASNGPDTTAVDKSNLDGSAAMAAALSKALCVINRFLVASGGGVSALSADRSDFWSRPDDEGVLQILGDGKKRPSRRNPGAWSPRVLTIQASHDRTRDYNAFMNCAFAASKHNVVLDGCYLPSGMSDDAKSSPFLEQACDLTGGVFLAPSGVAQVGGALTEVLLSVFLAPRSVRSSLNLPALNKVDFRARCFETGESVDMGFVCNQCLSIFKNRPKDFCPTCEAVIRPPVEAGAKRRRSSTAK